MNVVVDSICFVVGGIIGFPGKGLCFTANKPVHPARIISRTAKSHIFVFLSVLFAPEALERKICEKQSMTCMKSPYA